ncbi:hypothetical protein P7C70_g8974, partial [Phenoliferia sp. Uapishka_3]
MSSTPAPPPTKPKLVPPPPTSIPSTTSSPRKANHRRRKPASKPTTPSSSSEPNTNTNPQTHASTSTSTRPGTAASSGNWRDGPSSRGATQFGPSLLTGRGGGGVTRGSSPSGRAFSHYDATSSTRAKNGPNTSGHAGVVEQAQAQAQGNALPGRPGVNGSAKRPPRGSRAPRVVEDEGMSSADESGPLLAMVSLSQGQPGGLSQEILNLYATQLASPAALSARAELIARLNHILNTENFRWGHTHNSNMYPVAVEPFGSVRFGLSTSSSDLDLCIFDPYRPHGFDEKFFRTSTGASEEFPSIYDMREIGRRLQRHGFGKIRSVPFAAVPIVKFEAKVGKEVIQVDINTNERLGVLNSRLLNAYCSLHPAVRPLCVFLKFWSKQRELNDPGGVKGPVTFSSYTLILLAVAYLQSVDLLPNLQDPFLISRTGTPRETFWTRPRVGGGRPGRSQKRTVQPSIGWDVTFVEELPEGLEWKADEIELEELAKGFFGYYMREFEMERMIVSIQNGTPMERER